MPLRGSLQKYIWRARTGLYARIRDRYINHPMWKPNMRNMVAAKIWEVMEEIVATGRATRANEAQWTYKFVNCVKDLPRNTRNLADFINGMVSSIRYNLMRHTMKKFYRRAIPKRKFKILRSGVYRRGNYE